MINLISRIGANLLISCLVFGGFGQLIPPPTIQAPRVLCIDADIIPPKLTQFRSSRATKLMVFNMLELLIHLDPDGEMTWNHRNFRERTKAALPKMDLPKEAAFAKALH